MRGSGGGASCVRPRVDSGGARRPHHLEGQVMGMQHQSRRAGQSAQDGLLRTALVFLSAMVEPAFAPWRWQDDTEGNDQAIFVQ